MHSVPSATVVRKQPPWRNASGHNFTEENKPGWEFSNITVGVLVRLRIVNAVLMRVYSCMEVNSDPFPIELFLQFQFPEDPQDPQQKRQERAEHSHTLHRSCVQTRKACFLHCCLLVTTECLSAILELKQSMLCTKFDCVQ